MQLTLEIPDEMVSRLRPYENRLPRVLELGLDALETTPGLADDGSPDDRDAATWRLAAGDLTARAQTDEPGESPTPEELLAYAEGTLGAAESADLKERLALDPEAVDELLDLYRFEDLEPPSSDRAISQQDVQQALGALRRKVASQQAEETSSSRRSGVLPNKGWSTNLRRIRKHIPSLALAASLMLFLGSMWPLLRQPAAGTAYHIETLEIGRNRAGDDGEPHTVDSGSEWLQLVLKDTQLPAGEEGAIVVSTRSGHVVSRSAIRGNSGQQTSIALPPLSRSELPVGVYSIDILDSQGKTVDHFRISLTEPPET